MSLSRFEMENKNISTNILELQRAMLNKKICMLYNNENSSFERGNKKARLVNCRTFESKKENYIVLRIIFASTVHIECPAVLESIRYLTMITPSLRRCMNRNCYFAQHTFFRLETSFKSSSDGNVRKIRVQIGGVFWFWKWFLWTLIRRGCRGMKN